MDKKTIEANQVRRNAIEKKLDYIGLLVESLRNDAEYYAWGMYGPGDAVEVARAGVSAESIDRLITISRAELQRLRGLL